MMEEQSTQEAVSPKIIIIIIYIMKKAREAMKITTFQKLLMAQGPVSYALVSQQG